MKSSDRAARRAMPLRERAQQRAAREFLSAALEIVETPASPLGRAIAGTLILFFLLALAWAGFGHIDIVATAQGKIVPTERVKVIQPRVAGIVTAIRVRDMAAMVNNNSWIYLWEILYAEYDFK